MFACGWLIDGGDITICSCPLVDARTSAAPSVENVAEFTRLLEAFLIPDNTIRKQVCACTSVLCARNFCCYQALAVIYALADHHVVVCVCLSAHACVVTVVYLSD